MFKDYESFLKDPSLIDNLFDFKNENNDGEVNESSMRKDDSDFSNSDDNDSKQVRRIPASNKRKNFSDTTDESGASDSDSSEKIVKQEKIKKRVQGKIYIN